MPRKSTTKFHPIPDHDGYEITRDGQIRAEWRPGNKHGREENGWVYLKPTPHRKGYLTVWVRDNDGNRKLKKIHSLVLLTFRGPRPAGQECCHKDHDKSNNNISNLYYGTSLQNKADSVSVRKHAFGSRSGRAKLTEDDIPRIRQMIREGTTQKYIADAYHVSKPTIQAIAAQRTWRHVP